MQGPAAGEAGRRALSLLIRRTNLESEFSTSQFLSTDLASWQPTGGVVFSQKGYFHTEIDNCDVVLARAMLFHGIERWCNAYIRVEAPTMGVYEKALCASRDLGHNDRLAIAENSFA